jgi:hypothetical protein
MITCPALDRGIGIDTNSDRKKSGSGMKYKEFTSDWRRSPPLTKCPNYSGVQVG